MEDPLPVIDTPNVVWRAVDILLFHSDVLRGYRGEGSKHVEFVQFVCMSRVWRESTVSFVWYWDVDESSVAWVAQCGRFTLYIGVIRLSRWALALEGYVSSGGLPASSLRVLLSIRLVSSRALPALSVVTETCGFENLLLPGQEAANEANLWFQNCLFPACFLEIYK